MTTTKLNQRYTPINAYEIYLDKVSSTINKIRIENLDSTFLPSNFNGLDNQRNMLIDKELLNVITFDTRD